MTSELWAVLGIYSFLLLVLIVVATFFKFRYRILRGRIRIRVVSETGQEVSKVFKLEQLDANTLHWNIFGKPRTFNIRESRRTFTGGEEMPTLTYEAGDGEPKDLRGDTSPVSSIRMRQVAKNTIMSDLLDSFKKKLISSEMALLITMVAIVFSALALGLFLNDKLDKLEARLPIPQSTGTEFNPDG